jgi:ribosomal protein S27AE
MTQKCPKCGRWLAKNVEADHLIAGAYFYQCGHCGYVSELLTDGDLTFGENYPMFLEHNTNWANRKKYEIERLKKEHIKIKEIKMNNIEFKVLLAICLISLSYCLFWTIVYVFVDYIKRRKR